jgi:uncharacterized membrane protein
MAGREAGPERLGAFSDGVIAVIITIMVLELKAPHVSGLNALLCLWPSFLSYALSYIFVGIVWINHHHLLRYVERANPAVIGTNLVFLFFVSLIPFFTAYVAETRLSSFSTAAYAGVFLCVTLVYILFEWAIWAQLKGPAPQCTVDLVSWRNWVGLAFYALAIPAAYLHPAISLTLIFSVAVVYSTPHWRRPATHK